MVGRFRYTWLCVFRCLGKSSQKHPRKLTWQWNNNHWKMYLLLNMGMFRCHLSFQRSMLGLQVYTFLGFATWKCFSKTAKNKKSQMVVSLMVMNLNPCLSQSVTNHLTKHHPNGLDKTSYTWKTALWTVQFPSASKPLPNHQKSGGIPTKNGYKFSR